MKISSKYKNITSKKEPFVKQATTRIWQEIPSSNNPYISKASRCFGYDILDLAESKEFTDIIYLLLKGDLPTKSQSKLFKTLLICIINPGPRHPAVRASMNAGVGKTDISNILPIGLSILGGEYLGGKEVSTAMSYIKSNYKRDINELISALDFTSHNHEEHTHIVPGFGSHFGDIDIFTLNIAERIINTNEIGPYTKWCSMLSLALNKYKMSWLTPGLVASILLDLGFHPRHGAGLMQIAASPGLFAHGIELANKPRTAMPFLDDEDYEILTRKD